MQRGLVLAGLRAACLLAGACTGSNPDFMADAALCNVGGRQCIGALPVVCGRLPGLDMDTGVVGLIREECPVSAACDNGRCIAPNGAKSCARQQDCPQGQVCVPLVQEAPKPELLGYCVAVSQNPLPPGAPCEMDADCQSFLCLQHTVHRYCLEACRKGQDLDCGIPRRCRTFTVTVTGVQGPVQSCSSE